MVHGSQHKPPAGAAPRPPEGVEERRLVTFESLELHADLLKGIHDMGFIRPTPIQARAIPPILQGRDVIGLAQTGTGKTAAFVLPILHRLLLGKRAGHVRALFVSPTRELALQSTEHLKALSKHVHLRGTAIFGGVPMDPQIRALAQGPDIISATPGRLLDHIYSGRIDFRDLETFVLDEVDRMLDMGFLPDIQNILRLLPERRQNLVFSATLPPDIAVLLQDLLRDPVTVQVGQRHVPPSGIRHAVYPVPRHLKTELLLDLLRKEGVGSVLVFTRTKRAAEHLFRDLEKSGVKVSVLHGDRSQGQRLRALEKFREGQSQVMVATDIAARGIDIEDISHVINYDVPDTPESYIHRIGRTGRVEATGDAFTLVDKFEEPRLADIEKTLGKDLPRVTLPHFHYRKPPPPSHPGGGRPGHRRHEGGYGHGHGHRSGHARHGGGHGPRPRHR